MRCLSCQEELDRPFIFGHFFYLKKEEHGLCKSCRSNFEKLGSVQCQRCCKPCQEDICRDCLMWEEKGYLVEHKSLYRYNSAMKDYFQSYKFQGDYLLRKVFTNELKEVLKSYKDYTIVPVPVSQQTYEERGFNQVEGFLSETKLPYLSLLWKKEEVKQSHLSRLERLQMKNHYGVKDGFDLPEKILVVDDIYTTGATLLSIKELLSEKGVKSVKTFSLCR